MLTANTSRKNKLRARESGQAAVFLVLAMGLFLIGSMGFVVDGANLWFHRQSAQTAADAACTAGAMNMLSAAAGATPPNPNWIGTSFHCSGSTGKVPNSGFTPCQYAAFNGYTSSGLQANQTGTDVSVTFPGSFSSMPSCSSGTALCKAEAIADTPYIQVNIIDRVQTTFIGMLNGGHTVDVGAHSMCGLSNVLSAVPVLVLNPNAPSSPATNTMNAADPSNLTILNGPSKSIQVNSTDAHAVDLTSVTIGLSGDFSVAARESMSAANGTNLDWVSAAGVISDPFASVPAPAQPPPAPKIGSDCPGIPGLGGDASCQHYSPGYYAGGITVAPPSGPGEGDSDGPPSPTKVVAVFDPGIYYLDGNFTAGPNTCLRPNTTPGIARSSGTVFYFHGTSTLLISGTSGGMSSGTFNCATTPVSISSIQCTGSTNPLLSSLPSGGLTGNVLLGPCEAPGGDPLQPYGDPLGSADPSGEQRGMLFFQDRDSQPANQPKWHASGSFGLIGNMYFHYCKSSSGAGSGANCDPSAFSDVFNLGSGSGSAAYVVGDIVVDQLRLGEGAGTSPIKVSLNPNAQYYVLKASLLQ